ncbi:MAG: two pore domain potassium channel family protein [Myxococcales bacterium]|nr:two pore domain potassium channel family protein [Myxococcales bacterium]
MIQRLQSRLRPFACTVLLAALAAVALARAMRADDAGSAPLFGTLTTLLLVAAVFFAATRRSLFWLALALGAPDVLLHWSGLLFEPPPWLAQAALVSAVPFCVVLVAALASHVFRRDRAVNADRIAGAIAIYLLLALTFAALYALVLSLDAKAFYIDAARAGRAAVQRSDLLYFSVSTLTTLGYGDITPVSPVARALTMFESVTGVMFIAVLVARLVSLYRFADAAEHVTRSRDDVSTP